MRREATVPTVAATAQLARRRDYRENARQLRAWPTPGHCTQSSPVFGRRRQSNQAPRLGPNQIASQRLPASPRMITANTANPESFQQPTTPRRHRQHTNLVATDRHKLLDDSRSGEERHDARVQPKDTPVRIGRTSNSFTTARHPPTPTLRDLATVPFNGVRNGGFDLEGTGLQRS